MTRSGRGAGRGGRGRGCGACLDCCPTGALALRAGKASVDKTLCVGCGACLRASPTGAASLLRDPPS